MYDVIVIGCGASGVAALNKLYDSGLSVLGLEADDRIGGRIHTVPFGKNVIDLGAQWCHGENGNAVFEFVKDMNVLGRPEPDTKLYIQANGKQLDAAETENSLKEFDKYLEAASKDCDVSIPQFLRESFQQAVENGDIKNEPLAKGVLEFYERVNHMAGSSDPDDFKSLRGLTESWPCDGEFMLNWKDKGFIKLFDILLNGKKIDILTKKKVVTVRWGSETSPGSCGPLVQIKCADGSFYSAKHVIVTMSVGVLKETYPMFTPSLPEEKLTTIENLTMCVLDKIYIEFSNPWWPCHPYYITVIWTEEDKQKWNGNEKWLTEVFAFSSVEHQPNILCAWIYGNGAESMEKDTDLNVHIGIQKLLVHLFGGKVSKVVAVKRSKWASNPLVRGTYSYRSVKAEKTLSSALNLSEPLYCDGHPVVCFAGEATSIHRHGSVHGAVEAGFREAQRIMKYHKKH